VVPFFWTRCSLCIHSYPAVVHFSMYRFPVHLLAVRLHAVARSSVGVTWLVYCSEPPLIVVRPRPVYQRRRLQSVVMPCTAASDSSSTLTWIKVQTSAAAEQITRLSCCGGTARRAIRLLKSGQLLHESTKNPT